MGGRLDIKVGNIRLAGEISGDPDTEPMILLHALGERGESWDVVRAGFDPYFRVISVDLRGHGDSDWPGVYSYELMRDDVLALLDQLDLRRVTLVGHSMGGVVAYLIAQDHPALVDRLVVEDAVPPYPRDRPTPDRPDTPLPFDWPVVPTFLGHPGNDQWWDRLNRITAPLLLIGGGPSSHIPPDKLAEVAARVPDCTLLTIPVGHHIHVAAPAEFTAAVLGFVRP
ncbi:MAG: alpha/beta hydrolase [Sporichthyaceae bacterium]|nr:alpha/beta hydrolase [Sporichthyaceae bacterium]